MRSNLELKNNQITSYLMEIKILNQKNNQLNQNILELELKNAKMTDVKMHIGEQFDSSSDKNDTCVNLANIIKVSNLLEHLIK